VGNPIQLSDAWPPAMIRNIERKDSYGQQQSAATAAGSGGGARHGRSSTTAPDLTVTKYQQLADDFLKSLATLSAAIPVPSSVEAFIGRTRCDTRVSRGFLEAGIAAAAEVPELQAVTRFDVDAAREALQFIDAWTPVLPSVIAFRRRLHLALAVRKSPLVTQVRSAYAVANGIAKGNPDASVATHAKAMKEAAKFGSGRKKKEVATPTQT
jgi:hypothetical protein